MNNQCWEELDKLVLVAGHAVYIAEDYTSPNRDECWILKNFQKGEPTRYIEHIQFGIELAAIRPNALLVFSGGQTSLEAGPRSEAQSYWLIANHFSWWEKMDVRERATTEEFARDSFENVLFGIARFRECTGHYPSSLEIVGWEFKRNRFDFHCKTIRWPVTNQHYSYHGVNNPDDRDGSKMGEKKVLEAFKQDPLGTGKDLAAKRDRRNPFHRQHPYAESCPEIAALLKQKTTDGIVFEERLPWILQGPKDKRSI